MFVELGANAVTSPSVVAMRCFSFISVWGGRMGACSLLSGLCFPSSALACYYALSSTSWFSPLSCSPFLSLMPSVAECRPALLFFSWCFLPMRVWLTALLWQKQFCCFFFLTPFTCLRHLVSFSSHGLLSKGIVALSNTYVLTASSFCYFTKELYGSMSHHGNKWVLLPPSRGSSSVCLFHL